VTGPKTKSRQRRRQAQAPGRPSGSRDSPASSANVEREDWTIERLVPGGDAIAHLSDGRVAFVNGAIPGDVIRPLGVETAKGNLRATRFELLRPSPHRVTPPCPSFGACGGCDWMAIERSQQVVQKGAVVRDALLRVGRLSSVPEKVPVETAGGDLEYRNRVRFHIDPSGQVGFFARGSHQLVPIPRCMVCRPELNEALKVLRAAPRDPLCAFSAVDVRCSDEAPRVALHFTPRVRGATGLAQRALAASLPKDWAVTVTEDARGANPEREEQSFPLLPAVRLRALPGVFTQVNWAVNVALVEAVVSGAKRRGVRRFLDAYAGAGNFSLPLLAAGMTGISVDSDGRAIESGRRQAEALGLDAGGFVAEDAARLVSRSSRAKEAFDLVLLDPPRSGAREVLGSVAALAPSFIAYCSCDPVTLARDLATLVHAGYALSDVRAYDMFPHTHHVETVAWLERAPGAPS
jgi:23S rRNA (uracil1939-C5)-methyltransferase